MTGRIIAAGLSARPVRTTVSVLAVALEVTLILSIVGLVAGVMRGSSELITQAGADVMIAPPTYNFIAGQSRAVLPETIADNLGRLNNVKAATPIMTATSSSSKKLQTVWGIDPPSYDKITGGFRFVDGKIFETDDEVIVDDLLARDMSLSVGTEVELLGTAYKVSGIVAHGKGARVMMKISGLQRKEGAIALDAETGKEVGKATFFFLKLTDPSLFDTFKEENTALSEYSVINLRDYLSQMNNSIPLLDEFRAIVVFISMCVGILVIFLSTYTTITERTREIGILRSLGATRSVIVKMVIQESLLICVAGALIGTGASFVIARIVSTLFPTQSLDITGGWILTAICFALISGVLGALYPAIKAAKQDPIEALAYE